jgi:hypothetical protein
MFKICFDYLYPALRPTHYAVDSRRKGGEFHPNIRICDFLGGLLFRYVPQKFKFFIILRNVNYIFPNTKTLMPLGQYMHAPLRKILVSVIEIAFNIEMLTCLHINEANYKLFHEIVLIYWKNIEIKKKL